MGDASTSIAANREERVERGLTKIRRDLGPLISGLLEDAAVVEIMLNPDGTVWVERQGAAMERVGLMSATAATSLITGIAGFLETTITRFNPILECELPIDGSRFQALLPPIVPGPAFTIRRKAARVFSLEEYVAAGTMTLEQQMAVEDAVRARHNILVVGGTGTGKTTLTNAIIKAISEIDPHSRLVVLEDTPELQSPAENVFPLRTSETVDMLQLLRATMRLRPDRILVGEVRGAEALSLIKAWNTGHPGGVATVHANDALAGLHRLESLCSEASQTPRHIEIATAVNLVVSIAKTPQGRRVREVLRVLGHEGGIYLTEKVGQGKNQ